jgi:soluble lytic murein transglycosylase-like protein
MKLIIIVLLLIPSSLDIDSHYERHSYPWLDYELYTIVAEHAELNGLPTALVLAVIDAESDGNKWAVSRTGARGLMQIQAKWHYSGDPRDLHNRYLNVMLGTRHLGWCVRHAGGNVAYALKGYERGFNGRGYNMRYTQKILLAME